MILLLLAIAASRMEAASRGIKIRKGPGTFVFVDHKGDRKKQTTIYTYLPEGLDVTKAPIAFIIHGVTGPWKAFATTGKGMPTNTDSW